MAKINRRIEKLAKKVEEISGKLSSIQNERLPTASISSRIDSLGQLPSPDTRATTSSSFSVSDSAARPTSYITSWSETDFAPTLHSNGRERDIIDRGVLTLEHARTLLDMFHHSYAKHFPFLILSPDTTVESLRHQKPFLFLCIMAITLFSDAPLQRFLGKEIQKQVSTRVVVRNEHCLDLLQGLLLYTAYNHHFFTLAAQQIYLMLQLALTLVHEMGLYRPARSRQFEVASPELGKPGNAERYGRRTAEELRTFLGILVLSDEY